MNSYTSILKWVAGSNDLLPNDLDFDTATLLKLVSAHNLSGRFMKRMSENKATWITTELADGIEGQYLETSHQVARNIGAFGDLRCQLSKGTRIILIKGISIYVLSGQKEAMRAGDIDLLSDSPNHVAQTLLNMGYNQTRVPFMHELGEYTKGGTEFDIHEYFPVYGYTTELTKSDLVPAHHMGIWEQSFHFHHSRITFGDLEKKAHWGQQSDTSSVLVPDPNLLAIILCAHAFMNYTNMWSISHREKAYVRLAEITDLFTLAAHSSFSPEQFLFYVDRYNAIDAVEWAASIAVSIFGKNPLPVKVNVKRGDALPSARFPRCLWWNFWASLESDIDDLLITNWLSLEWLTKQIGSNHIFIHDGQIARYSIGNSDVAFPLTHYMTQLSESIPLSLDFMKGDDGLLLQLRVFATTEVDTERVRVDLGEIASEWIYFVREDRQVVVGSPLIVFRELSQPGYGITIKIPWNKLNSIKNSRTVPLLIGVARLSNLGGLLASVLIPTAINL